MNLNAEIYDAMKKNNNMITTAQVLSMGYSKPLLTRYVKEGLIERARHGLYILPNSLSDDLYVMMLRSEKIIFSHETAGYLNNITGRAPIMPTVTIPSTTALPKSLKGSCYCYYIKPELHKVGVIERQTPFGNMVRCYDVERTLCDFLRSNSRTDEETIVAALKTYASSKDKDLNRLSYYGELFKVNSDLQKYLRVLL